MSKPFDAKVAIVTGGASGIGRALGEALARGHAQVILADIDEPGVQQAAEAIRSEGGSAKGVTLDVTDAPAVTALVESVAKQHGRLDLMFNNAGIAILGDTLDFPLEDWNRLIDINIRGVVHGTVAAYKLMAAQGSGHIVNTASVAGLIPAPGFAVYSMTKHAVVGLSKSMRLEAEAYGVRITAVCPGLIDTPLKERSEMRGDVNKEEALERNPIKFYPAEDCARDILAGVAKNRALVVVTGHAKIAETLYRLAPELSMRTFFRHMEKQRREISKS